MWRDTRVYHAFVGNDSPEVQTGLTRGLVAAVLSEGIFVAVRWLPLPPQVETDILTHMAATVILVSFVLYAYLDKWMKGHGWKP